MDSLHKAETPQSSPAVDSTALRKASIAPSISSPDWTGDPGGGKQKDISSPKLDPQWGSYRKLPKTLPKHCKVPVSPQKNKRNSFGPLLQAPLLPTPHPGSGCRRQGAALAQRRGGGDLRRGAGGQGDGDEPQPVPPLCAELFLLYIV